MRRDLRRRRAVAESTLRRVPRVRPDRQVSSDYKMPKGKGLRRGAGVEVSFFTVSARCDEPARGGCQVVSGGMRDHVLD